MTVLNFPSPSASPYEVNGVRYTWDGEAWVAAGGGDVYLKSSGGNITGAVTNVETTISGTWDLSAGPFFYCSGGAVPAFENGVAGASGLIRVGGAITSWPAGVSAASGVLPTPTATPAIIPFYVDSASTVIVGDATAPAS